MNRTQDNRPAWKSPWVLAWLGLVVVVLGVNIFMIYLSAAHNPGLVVEDYYERGRALEENVEKRLAKDPGWEMTLKAPEFVLVSEPVLFRLRVIDKQGDPAAPEKVTFFAYRPSDARQDFSLPMKQVAPGDYQAEIRFPLQGVWDILVAAAKGGDEFHVPLRISAGVADRL